MNNYYHWDSGKQGKVSAGLDVNFSKLRNFDSKAEGFSHGPGQSYSLDLDYEMDEANKLNLYLDYQKQKYDFEAIYPVGGRKITWDNQREYERKLASLTYEGQNKKHVYSVTASYGELESVGFTREWVNGSAEKLSAEEIIANARDIIPGIDGPEYYNAAEILEIKYA